MAFPALSGHLGWSPELSIVGAASKREWYLVTTGFWDVAGGESHMIGTLW